MFPLIGISAAFALLSTLILLKVDFGKAILVSTAVLLVLSEPSMKGIGWIIAISLEYETLELIAIIVQIVFIGYLYKDSGQVMRLIEILRSLVPDRRMVVASIPALFGLMPMPGGAYVSAPMIEDEADYLELDGKEKTFLNWWWRHIWFWIYPLSVGLILASGISGINLYHIALFNIPIFLIHVSLGVFFGLKKIEVKPTRDKDVNPFLILYELLPIILALSLDILFGVPLYVSLFLAIILLFFQNKDKYTKKNIPSTIREGFSVDILMAAYGIMLFKGIIERTESLGPVVNTLEGYVPALLIVIVSAYGIGLLFGHLPSAIGVGFPILLPLLPVVNVRTVSMMYVFVLLGYFTSPIHLCIILTIEYFGIDLKTFYKRILKPISILILSIIAYFIINGTFFLFF